MRTILYYLNVKHIRVIWWLPPIWPEIFKIVLMFFLRRIISNPFQSPVVLVLPMKGKSPEYLKLPASILLKMIKWERSYVTFRSWWSGPWMSSKKPFCSNFQFIVFWSFSLYKRGVRRCLLDHQLWCFRI